MVSADATLRIQAAFRLRSRAIGAANIKRRYEKEKRQKEITLLSYTLHKADVKDWLLQFAECVREQRFTEAKELFCPNVVGFGTRARRVASINDLCAEQWKRIWPNTKGFEFNFEELDFYHDEHMVHVAVTWHSTARQFGVNRRRAGRASILLLGKNGKLKCASSHFSLDP